MITLQQWRIAIGCFHPCGCKLGTYNFTKSKCFHSQMSFIMVSVILSLLLFMAGDVELNPGPFRKCPHCQCEIPIRQKKCKHCGLLVKSFISSEKQLTQNTQYYQENVVNILAKRVESYKQNPEKQKALSKASYKSNPEKQKALSKASYRSNPEKQKALSKASYRSNPEKQKALSKASYRSNPEKQKALSKASYKSNPDKQKAWSKLSYRANPEKFKAVFRMNYAKNRETKCANERNKYVLAEPKLDLKEQYMKEIQFNLLDHFIAWLQLFKAYKREHADLAKRMSKGMSKAVCKIAAKKILNKTLQMRKEYVGSLLKAIRLIKRLDIKVKEDFEGGCHTTPSEPYYYDEAYQLIKRDTAIPVDHNGKCVIAKVISK